MADYDASIVAQFGGDTTGLSAAITQSETMVAGMEKRFEQMGVSMGSAPKKFAEESAKAFDAVFKAEDELASVRQKNLFTQMSDTDKLNTLRGQANAILTQINSIEGQTVEKVGLQVEFERKKSAIYDLNQKLTREGLAVQKDVTGEIGEGGKKLTGMAGVANDVKEGFKAMGISLKGAGLGIILAQVVALSKEAVQEAQKQRDEYERLGKPLDNATASMARFGDAVGTVRKGAVEAVGFLIGGYTQLGELLGSAINRLRGISELEERIAESAGKAADASQRRVAALKAEQADEEKLREAKKKTAEMEARAAFEKLDANGKINALLAQNVKLYEQSNALAYDGLNDEKRKQQILENNEKIRQLELKLAEETKRAEEDKTKEIEKGLRAKQETVTVDEEMSIWAATLTTQYGELTQEVLKRLLAEGKITEEMAKQLGLLINQSNVPPPKGHGGGGGGGNGPNDPKQLTPQEIEKLKREKGLDEESLGRKMLSGMANTAHSQATQFFDDIEAAADDVLKARRKQLVEAIEAIDKRPISGPEIVSNFYGRNMEKYPLAAEIDKIDEELRTRTSLRRADARGGRGEALQEFTKTGANAYAFDAVFAQIQSQTGALDENVKIGREARDSLREIKTTLRNTFGG